MRVCVRLLACGLFCLLTACGEPAATVEAPEPARRILSTSVTLTGTLLAIDAPVVASASAANGQFFAQWAEVAAARGVENAWAAGSVDLEAAHAIEPDLIVLSASGADSALDQLAELQAIAPTLVLDYGRLTWQELARELGAALGLERQAQARIASFERDLAAARAKLALPSGVVNIISYNGPGASNPVATRHGVHGQLLESLGFVLEQPRAEWHAGNGVPGDFVWTPYEHLVELEAPTTFLLQVAGDERGDRVEAFLRDPVLANLPSVRSGQVYGLGANSFRIDYFSAREIVDGMLGMFAR